MAPPLLQAEGVTLAAGVPTIWIAALPLLQAGKYDISSTTRIVVGGSAFTFLTRYERDLSCQPAVNLFA